MGCIRLKTQGIALRQAESIFSGAYVHIPRKYGNIFFRAGHMGLGGKKSAGLYLYSVGFKQFVLLEGKGRIVNIFSAVLYEGRYILRLYEQGRLGVAVHKTGKGDLISVGYFQSTDMVGLTSPFSICASILLDTPVWAAAASNVSFLRSLIDFIFSPIICCNSMASPLDNIIY